MDLETMIRSVRDDTQISNAQKIIDKLNSGQAWVTDRVLVMDENILKVSNDQNTLGATTSTYDLAANVNTGVLYQLKWLGVRLSGDTKFQPIRFVDSSDNEFISLDQETTTATSHPVLCAVENFNQVRFAPPLASGVVIRTDYIYKPAPLSLESNIESDLPETFHETIVAKAKAEAFAGIDDDRIAYFERMALDKLYAAMNVLGQRQLQQPPRTRPFRTRRLRTLN